MKAIDIMQLLDLMPLHVYWKDKNGVYLGCNSAQAHSYGLKSSEEVIGKVDAELVDIDSARSWAENDQMVMKNGVPMVVEEKGVLNGKEVVGLSYKIPFKDERGNIAGIMGISIDITLQKDFQKQLVAEKNMTQTVLNSIVAQLPGHVYWMDEQNRYLGCNDMHATSAGLKDRFEIVGKKNHDLAWASQADILDKINDDIRKTGREYAKEESALMADGSFKTFISRKIPFLDDNQKPIGILGISFDITDRKNMEKELLRAKEAAEASNRAKTEFLANMSHDMKTPLTGVVGMADIMMNDSQTTDIDRQRAESIHACGLQAISLFDNCLTLSKMEMEEWMTKSEVFSVKKILEDIQSLFLPKAMAKQLTLTMICEEELPDCLEGHRESLYRILLNLVGNAIKFTEHGEIVLRVRQVGPIAEKRINVEFQVQDTGIGIPEDKHEIIFEKLRRLTPSYASNIEGSGIGLYIVDQYVKRMKGTVEVKSKVGSGSTFTVTIPLRIVSEKIDPRVGVAPVTSRFENNVTFSGIKDVLKNENDTENPPRVLVVEDIPMIQFVTKSLLERAGFYVELADTGEAAITMFSPGKYDLIYMDIGLPGIDGYQTTQAIREKEKSENVKKMTTIIALTGHGAVDVKNFCCAADMQAVISKPISPEQIEKIWRRYGKQEQVEVPGLTLCSRFSA